MKGPLSLLLGLGACLALGQLYPSKLGLLGSASLRLNEVRVQTELGLSEAQSKDVSKLMSSHASKQTAISKQMAKAKPDQYAALQASIENAEVSTSKSLLVVLSAGQRDRLMQLAIQDAGPFALRNEAVAQKIALTPEQRTKVNAIAAKTATTLEEMGATMATQLQAVPAGKAGDAKRKSIVKAYEPKMQATEKKGEQEILSVLSKAQLDSWGKAKGKPFKL